MIADKEKILAILEAVVAAKQDAKSKGFKRGNGGASEIPCPTKCGGVLRYSVAGVNGHLWAACTTKNCVRWME